MKTVAIYARYSTDLQSARSIEDQLRVCMSRAERENWDVRESYCDHAMSGASIMRPGLQQMLQDGREGKLDIILTESLDRLSRDQADIASIFKHMQFAGVEIITLYEGRVGILDIGLRGTMNQLYLVETANKSRRGQQGRVKAGKVAAGHSYGYDVVKRFDAAGMAVRGERKINKAQATMIRRIFREYVRGGSPRSIAKCLNDEGVPSPSGQEWNPSTIAGNRHFGIGILNNEFYIGRCLWNRRTFSTDPETGRRVYRYNPESAWLREEMPWLCIVPQDLWDRAKARQEKAADAIASAALRMAKVRYRQHFPKFLLSGLLTCGCCGGGFSVRRHENYGCIAHDNRDTCTNQLRIGRKILEDRVLRALKRRLIADPERCAAFCEGYARRLADLRVEHKERVRELRDELARVELDYDRLTDAPSDGAADAETLANLKDTISRHGMLSRMLRRAVTVEPLERHYEGQVSALVDSLNQNRNQLDSFHAFRAQIGEIVLTPNKAGTELLVDVGRGPTKRRKKRKMFRDPLPDVTTTDIMHSRAPYFGLSPRGRQPLS